MTNEREGSPFPEIHPTISKELILEIVSLLSGSAKIKLARASKAFHATIIPIIYRQVEVSAREARRFFITIAYPKTEKWIYGPYVESLTFKGINTIDSCTVYPMLCRALTKMPNLETLQLVTPKIYNTNLVQLLKQVELIRSEGGFFHGLSNLRYTPDPVTPLHLQWLKNLRISGDLRLSSFIRLRNIHSLQLSRSMSLTDLDALITNVHVTSRGACALENLSLVVETSNPFENMFTLLGMVESIPSLRELSLYVPQVNALAVSHLLVCKPVLAARLKSLSVNPSSHMPTFIPDIDLCLDQQHSHLTSAKRQTSSSQNPSICKVQFGTIVWDADKDTGKWDLVDAATPTEVSRISPTEHDDFKVLYHPDLFNPYHHVTRAGSFAVYDTNMFDPTTPTDILSHSMGSLL